ncbi:MAG: response regulator [Gaiellales bacterium]
MASHEDVIRIAICEDHRILADTLVALLQTHDDFEVVAPPVTHGEDAVALAQSESIHVILMDIGLGGEIDGIEATRLIKGADPSVQVLILSGQAEDRYLLQAVEAGASGFITKGEGIDQVLNGLRAAARGEMLVSPLKLARLVRAAAASPASGDQAGLKELTGREKEILELMASGKSNDMIAEHLTISPHTVQTHVRNLLGKLGAHSRLEAVTVAARNGLISL